MKDSVLLFFFTLSSSSSSSFSLPSHCVVLFFSSFFCFITFNIPTPKQPSQVAFFCFPTARLDRGPTPSFNSPPPPHTQSSPSLLSFLFLSFFLHHSYTIHHHQPKTHQKQLNTTTQCTATPKTLRFELFIYPSLYHTPTTNLKTKPTQPLLLLLLAFTFPSSSSS